MTKKMENVHTNADYMKGLINSLGEGTHYMVTGDNEDCALVIEDDSVVLRIRQESKPLWDIVVYYDRDGYIEGEGVKPSIWKEKGEEVYASEELLEELMGAKIRLAELYAIATAGSRKRDWKTYEDNREKLEEKIERLTVEVLSKMND